MITPRSYRGTASSARFKKSFNESEVGRRSAINNTLYNNKLRSANSGRVYHSLPGSRGVRGVVVSPSSSMQRSLRQGDMVRRGLSRNRPSKT
jgi:hypothetical protein